MGKHRYGKDKGAVADLVLFTELERLISQLDLFVDSDELKRWLSMGAPLFVNFKSADAFWYQLAVLLMVRSVGIRKRMRIEADAPSNRQLRATKLLSYLSDAAEVYIRSVWGVYADFSRYMALKEDFILNQNISDTQYLTIHFVFDGIVVLSWLVAERLELYRKVQKLVYNYSKDG